MVDNKSLVFYYLASTPIKFDYVAEVCRVITLPLHTITDTFCLGAFGGPSDPSRPYFTARQTPAPASHLPPPPHQTPIKYDCC